MQHPWECYSPKQALNFQLAFLHQVAFPKVVWSSGEHQLELAHNTGDQSRVGKRIQGAPGEKEATIYSAPTTVPVTSQIIISFKP